MSRFEKKFISFQLEIIDACVTYIEKLQSQLLVKPNFEEEDEGIEDGDLDQQRQRLEEDCNGNLEK
jgi:hypothetical protein